MKELAGSPDATRSNLVALIDRGQDINGTLKLIIEIDGKKYQVDATPLMIACAKNTNPRVVELLIELGAEVEPKLDFSWGLPPEEMPPTSGIMESIGLPIDFAAAFNPNPEVIHCLVDAGAKANLEFGGPLIRAAALNPNPKVATALISRGANVNQIYTSPLGMGGMSSEFSPSRKLGLYESRVTPLHAAARSNSNPEVVRELITNGADMEIRGMLNQATPLFAAVMYGKNPKVAAALIDSGANIHTRDKYGMGLVQASNINPSMSNSEAKSMIHSVLKTNNRKRHTSKDGLFSYEIPFGWSCEEFPGAKYQICTPTNITPSEIANINVVFERSNLSQLDYYAASGEVVSRGNPTVQSQILASASNWDDVRLTTGLMVFGFTYNSMNSGVLSTVSQAFVRVEEGYLVFTLTCRGGNNEKTFPKFKKLVRSIWTTGNANHSQSPIH